MTKNAPKTTLTAEQKKEAARTRMRNLRAARKAAIDNNDAARAVLPAVLVDSENASKADILAAVAALPEDAPFLEPVPAAFDMGEDDGDANAPDPLVLEADEPAAFKAGLSALKNDLDSLSGLDLSDIGRGPGYRRLRAHPRAEEIRQNALNEAKEALDSAAALIAAARPKAVEVEETPVERNLRTRLPRASTAPKAAKAEKTPGKRAAVVAAAEAGILPQVPDFSANTHKPFRAKLDVVVEMVKAGDIAGLAAYEYKGFLSTSPKAIVKYRDLALTALKAQAAKNEAA